MAEVAFWKTCGEKRAFWVKTANFCHPEVSDMKNTFSRKQDNNGLKEETSSTSERKARSPKLCREHEPYYIQK